MTNNLLCILLRTAYAVSGKHLDMGKSCIRFKRLQDVELEVIKRIIGKTPMDSYVEAYRKPQQG